MSKWYIAVRGERQGPFSSAELWQRAARGELDPQDYVWRSDFGATWQRAGAIPGLLTPPPLPPAAPQSPMPLPDDAGQAVSSRQVLGNAWQRMKQMLFRPFDLTVWLTIGLYAWLSAAGRFDTSGVINGNDLMKRLNAAPHGDWHGQINALTESVRTQIAAMASWRTMVVVIGVAVLMLWVRSRGALMFIDRWQRPRATFMSSWQAARRLTGSLFRMRLALNLGFGLLLLAPAMWLRWRCGGLTMAWLDLSLHGRLLLTGALMLVAAAWLVVAELDNSLVVPLMYWRKSSATLAWRVVLRFCNRQPFSLLRFLVMRLGYEICVSLAVTLLSMFTCCVFWVILLIPYFGSVAMLPFALTRRGLGPECLRQWQPNLTDQHLGENL